MGGVEASKDGPCNFENLSLMVVICHCIIPMACLPLTWYLVPQVRMDDDAIFKEDSPAPSFRSPAPSTPASLLSPRSPSGGVEPGEEPGALEEFYLVQDNRQLSGFSAVPED